MGSTLTSLGHGDCIAGGEDGMSSTGLEVFDKTLQITYIRLDEIMSELGPDRHRAYHALRAVLQLCGTGCR
jgi:hypothetical protein